MNPLSYLRKLFDWLMNIPGEDGAEWEIANEPCDPQHITRIYGGGIETGLKP